MYRYNVSAYDAANNQGLNSTSASATTLPPPNLSCTQTLSPGANVALAVTSAAPGSIICLNSGSYGAVSLANFIKSPRVTIKSVSGQGGSFALSTNNVNGLTFDKVTITSYDRLQGSNTKNLTFQNCVATGRGWYWDVTGIVDGNLLIDNCTFINVGQSVGEGRLHITWPGGPGTQSSGVTVKNSLFENSPPGCTTGVSDSDGIQVGAYGVVIGPGNTFRGIQQGSCSAHVDSIQPFGQSHTRITGNFFINNEVNIGAYASGNTEQVDNNVFVLGASGVFHHNNVGLNLGPNSLVFHNTFKDVHVWSEGSNQMWRDNIFVNSDWDNGPLGWSGTQTTNLFDAASTPRGTNQILGSPTFIGGVNPVTWAGFQLATGSLGKNAASDGNDVGTNFYGP